MKDSAAGASLIAAPSFESRCVAGPAAFLEAGGHPAAAHFVSLGGEAPELSSQIATLTAMGFGQPATVDRLSARSLWDWTHRSVAATKADVIIDATCIPRELLAMLLFALSVRRNRIARVRVLYTPPTRYITQCDLPVAEKWLSRGIHTLRSVVGYPGDFASERNRHVVALAGHEDDRLFEILSYLEPTRLSIGNEQRESSTVAEAEKLSKRVMERLRETVGAPDKGEVTFYANSIDKTFQSLKAMLADQSQENVALVAMNTKLSFIGAALCALHVRHIRMVYAVPVEYNPRYSEGTGVVTEFEITAALKTAATTPAR